MLSQTSPFVLMTPSSHGVLTGFKVTVQSVPLATDVSSHCEGTHS